MGCKELIDALREEGEKKVQSIRRESESEAERIRAEAEKKIERIRDEYSKRRSSAIKEQRDAILSEAKKKAEEIKLLSERELSDRLYRLASSHLFLLRNERYGKVFDALVHELPTYLWKTVKVNPEDRGIAKEYFPEAEILLDGDITGGLEVSAEKGKILIRNTFEKRLERR